MLHLIITYNINFFHKNITFFSAIILIKEIVLHLQIILTVFFLLTYQDKNNYRTVPFQKIYQKLKCFHKQLNI